jgi:hypothetical protein
MADMYVKIYSLFYADNSWTVTLTRNTTFSTVQYHGRTYIFSLMKILNMTMVRNYEVMLEQTLNHSV